MTIILVSGDGIGAGKSTFADKFRGTHIRFSLADEIRLELQESYPGYPWMDKSQAAKMMLVKETGKTIRQMLIELGQSMRLEDPDFWCKRLLSRVDATYGHALISIDDIRFMNELAYFKRLYNPCLHFHMAFDGAIKEPQYENEQLKLAADYVVHRGSGG